MVEEGLGQGCVLSAYFFNIIMEDAVEEINKMSKLYVVYPCLQPLYRCALLRLRYSFGDMKQSFIEEKNKNQRKKTKSNGNWENKSRH